MKIYNITNPMQYLSLQACDNINVLWLDDERDPSRYFYPKTLNKMSIDIARNYKEFIEFIRDGKYANYDMICLDHDLGEENTGYDCVMELYKEYKSHKQSCGDIFIHTGNPGGKKRMMMVLDKIVARENQKRM